MMEIDIKKLLFEPIFCECGKQHKASLKEVEISKGALFKIPGLINRFGFKNALIVSDVNTHEVAGKTVCDILNANEIAYEKLVFSEKNLIAYESCAISIAKAAKSNTDVIIGVGSGTINDLCKYAAGILDVPHFIVATAPSMDGYASDGAALIKDGLKVTLPARSPIAIIGDTDTLKNAPQRMIAAGIGDMLGKYICLLDWRIAALITEEYYCAYTAGLVEASLGMVVKEADAIISREEGAVKRLTEGLIISGIAMCFAGSSRSASGSEHHLSHFWELDFMFRGLPPSLHGIKVGLGTVACAMLYKRLPAVKTASKPCFSYDKWESEIKRVYGPAAQGVLRLEAECGKNSPEKVRRRLEMFNAKRGELFSLIKELPEPEFIEELLSRAGAPTRPAQERIEKSLLYDSVLYAKELRNRYGLLQLLFDTGAANDLAEWLCKSLY